MGLVGVLCLWWIDCNRWTFVYFCDHKMVIDFFPTLLYICRCCTFCSFYCCWWYTFALSCSWWEGIWSTHFSSGNPVLACYLLRLYYDAGLRFWDIIHHNLGDLLHLPFIPFVWNFKRRVHVCVWERNFMLENGEILMVFLSCTFHWLAGWLCHTASNERAQNTDL